MSLYTDLREQFKRMETEELRKKKAEYETAVQGSTHWRMSIAALTDELEERTMNAVNQCETDS